MDSPSHHLAMEGSHDVAKPGERHGLRIRPFLLALVLALGVAGVVAAPAWAQAKARSTIKCASPSTLAVTWTFSEFPATGENKIKERIKLDGSFVYEGVFTFTGPSATNTVTIPISPGHHEITVFASWNGNGVKGQSDHLFKNGIECSRRQPAFTIEKQQRLQGESTYTTAELTGKLGQTVEYEVIVKNTGNTSLKFSKLSDANCEGISPSGEVELAPGAEAVYTCSHVLDKVGKYTNEATITGGEETKTSNKVTVNVPAEPSFTIEKQQRLQGESTYTTAELTGSVGQTIEYEVIVKNTGNTSLKFGKLSDAGCEGISPSGEVELAPGGEQVYTCSHVIDKADQEAGKHENNATITGTPPEGQGEPITHTSNTVIVKVPTPPTCPQAKIESNFNGTAVKQGDWIWFNSVLKPEGTTSGGTIRFTNQKVTIVTKKGTTTLSVPNATITFSPLATEGTTSFAGGEWMTTVPASFTDNVFLAGLAYQLPAELEGGANPVSWEGDFTTSPGVSLKWQWAAAVYTTFSSEYNSLEVKPLHSTTLDKYHNGNQAGTPEAFKAFVTGGARGGGGSNYTGSYSGTGSCSPAPAGNPVSKAEQEPAW